MFCTPVHMTCVFPNTYHTSSLQPNSFSEIIIFKELLDKLKTWKTLCFMCVGLYGFIYRPFDYRLSLSVKTLICIMWFKGTKLSFQEALSKSLLAGHSSGVLSEKCFFVVMTCINCRARLRCLACLHFLLSTDEQLHIILAWQNL